MIGGIDRPDLSKAEQSRGSRTAEQETQPLAIQVVSFFFSISFFSFSWTARNLDCGLERREFKGGRLGLH